MAQKIVEVPGIGQVLLAKRRNSRSFRISIQPNGQVRIGLPAWTPYSSAVNFALVHSDWIKDKLEKHQSVSLKDGDLIGKSYRLKFVFDPAARRTASRLGANLITITSSGDLTDNLVQSKAAQACERALKQEAQKLLAIRLADIAGKHKFAYKNLRIKRLSSRWGSCSHEGSITLSYFLIQLPWHLIDYVIIHELIHTKHLNHSPEFWSSFEKILPDVKQFRKEIKQYQPILLPS
jgi:predicted metal-dependent hydrolase